MNLELCRSTTTQYGHFIFCYPGSLSHDNNEILTFNILLQVLRLRDTLLWNFLLKYSLYFDKKLTSEIPGVTIIKEYTSISLCQNGPPHVTFYFSYDLCNLFFLWLVQHSKDWTCLFSFRTQLRQYTQWKLCYFLFLKSHGFKAQ